MESFEIRSFFTPFVCVFFFFAILVYFFLQVGEKFLLARRESSEEKDQMPGLLALLIDPL